MVVLSKPVAAIAVLASLFSSVAASPINSLEQLESRQTGSFYAITGVKIGGVQPRLEIRDLQKQPEQWNLFILALQRFQAQGQSVRESFYQVAGIHGEPYYPWDGVKGSGQIGYCTHASNLFGPWHRPYLALYEQIVSKLAQDIVNEFPAGSTKTKYQDAVQKLRLPYWDWAAKLSPYFPPSLALPTIGVTYPNGTAATIANPLFSYKFHPFNATEITTKAPDTETRRSPGADGQTNMAVVESGFQDDGPSLRTQIYNLLTTYQTYNQFSTFAGGSSFGSIEGVHGSVHVMVGGNGWMSPVSVSGFDPIFFLHHCNVDRQLALFQYMYPNTYVDPAPGTITYTIPDGNVNQTASSPLTPFHSNAQGTFWTSNTARLTSSMGYTYADLVGNPANATLRAKINTMYGPTTTSLKKRAEDQDAPRAYLAKIKVPVTGVQTTVKVSIAGTYVGSHSTMGKPVISAATFYNTGSVDLNDVLAKKHDAGDLKELNVDAVVAYLKDNLSYQVYAAGAETETPGDLSVEVISTEVKPPQTASDFPQWVGGFEKHPEITE